MNRILYIDESYFLILDKTVSPDALLERCRKRSGMKLNSFADMYVNKIMSGILGGAIDLYGRYMKYYSEEYDTFSDYLYQKELFEKDFVETINLGKEENLWKLNFTRNDYSIKSIVGYENENLSIINIMLEELLREN